VRGAPITLALKPLAPVTSVVAWWVSRHSSGAGRVEAKKNHPIGHFMGERHLVGDHDHGHSFLCQVLDDRQDFPHQLRIE